MFSTIRKKKKTNNRIAAYDFDGTLVYTPIKLYENVWGKSLFSFISHLLVFPKISVPRRHVNIVVTGRYCKYRWLTWLQLLCFGFWWVEKLYMSPDHDYKDSTVTTHKVRTMLNNHILFYVDNDKRSTDLVSAYSNNRIWCVSLE